MSRHVHITTFGCQMNKLDSDLFAQVLTEAGHSISDSIAAADTILINTCSVRDQAENRALSLVGTLKKRKQKEPGLLLGIMGCMAQRRGKELQKKYPQLDLIIGTRMFHQLAALLEEAESCPVVATDELSLKNITLPGQNNSGSPQAFLAAMRGCNNFCSYCIVPYVRGREESRSQAELLAEAEQLVNSGVREITLLGQSINAYGKDLKSEAKLEGLLKKMAALPKLRRLRFITSHPRDLSKEFFKGMADLEKVCEHLHLPAQSGSDIILKAMRRGYSLESYQKILAWGRELVPNISYSSDFIVGFPGETEADFLATCDLIKKEKFQNIYVFRYSPRPGTKAALLEDNVPMPEKEKRLQELLCLQNEINCNRNRKMVKESQVVEVMITGVSKRDKTKMAGRTRQNAIVMFPAPKTVREQNALPGREIRLKLTNSTALTLFGEVPEQDA